MKYYETCGFDDVCRATLSSISGQSANRTKVSFFFLLFPPQFFLSFFKLFLRVISIKIGQVSQTPICAEVFKRPLELHCQLKFTFFYVVFNLFCFGCRFRSAKEAEMLEKKATDMGQKLPESARFDSNCITPGTVFMVKLHEQLKYFITRKISEDPLWQKCTVILSGHEVTNLPKQHNDLEAPTVNFYAFCTCSGSPFVAERNARHLV